MKKLILFIMISFILSENIHAQGGKLDSSFGTNGIVRSVFEESTNFSSVALQSNGKIIAVGYVVVDDNHDFAVTRYNSDGTLDSTFSTGGKITTDFNSGDDYARFVAIQNDGKIVVVGSTFFFDADKVYKSNFAIARYNIDGTLDTTFSSDGRLTTHFEYNRSYGYSAAIQKDGKIVVSGITGYLEEGYLTSYTSLARYNSDGTLDTTFSGDGRVSSDFGAFDFGGTTSLAIQTDGKIIVSGPNLLRYYTNGSLDTTFRVYEKRIIYDDAHSLALQTDSKIVVVGNRSIVRYNGDGSLDSTFGGNGLIQVTYLNATSTAIQTDGKIVVAGGTYTSDTSDNYVFALTRFNTDGSLDYSFGKDGKQVTDVSDRRDVINDIVISSNKLYSAGTSGGIYPLDDEGIVARYLLNDKINNAPTVTLTSPVNNATYLAPANIKLSATASNADSTIGKVEFYNGTHLLHTETLAPYGFVWRDVRVGDYTLTAKAYDNSGNVTTSDAAHISVVPNKPPTVSIIKPSDNEHFAAPAYIHFEAAASDTDGRITRVEFYNGSTLIRTEYKYPYTYVWKNIPVGTYTITAVATDNWGAQTTSGPIIVKVKSRDRTIVSNKALINIKNSLSTAESLMLYPNPVNQTLNIYTKGLQPNKPATISIISVSGAVWKPMQSKSLNQTAQLDVSSLMKGVYIIKLISGDKVLYKRFIK